MIEAVALPGEVCSKTDLVTEISVFVDSDPLARTCCLECGLCPWKQQKEPGSKGLDDTWFSGRFDRKCFHLKCYTVVVVAKTFVVEDRQDAAAPAGAAVGEVVG